MASGSGKIARRYARSLFDICEPTEFDQMKSALISVAELWDENLELKAAFYNPTTSEQEKLNVVQDIAGRLFSGNEKFKNFLSLVAKNNRFFAIKEVSEVFSILVDQAKKLLSLEISSAFELDESEKQEIQNRIQKDFGSMASISWSIDPELLGGLLVKAGDRQLDGSVRGALEKLRTQLTG